MSSEPHKIIYSMIGVSKFYNKKPVIKDISLSFFYKKNTVAGIAMVQNHFRALSRSVGCLPILAQFHGLVGYFSKSVILFEKQSSQ